MMAGWSCQSFVVPNTPLTSLAPTSTFNSLSSLSQTQPRNGDVGFVIVPETPPYDRDLGTREVCADDEDLLNSLAHVNQELELLGLPCIPVISKHSKDLNPIVLLDRLHGVLKLYHKTMAVKEELDIRNHRLSCDLEHHQSLHKRQKRSMEAIEREANQDREKLRQLNLKYKSVSGQIKADEEELRKLVAMQGSRDLQYKHEQKKKEKELNKLKERLHQLIADKAPDRKVGMDIMSLVGGSDGRRATWKAAPIKQEEELYQVLVVNYEESRKELMQENAELRDCLLSLQRELSTLLKQTGDMSANPVMELSGHLTQSNPSSDEEEVDVGSRLSITDLEDGYFQMPCDIMRNQIQKMFKDTCDQISQSMKKSLVRNINKESLPLSSSRRMSQSSYSSSSEKVVTDRKASLSEVSEVERLKKQISNYKSIIEQQEDLIQQTLSSHSHSMESTFLHESQLMKEKDNLSEQRKLFADERSNFDKERKNFTEAAIRLAKEKKAFDADRAAMLKQQFLNLSPFKGGEPRKGKTAEGPSNRLLPATPVFSPAKSTTTDNNKPSDHLPTTQELFKALGLSKHKEDTAHPEKSPKTTSLSHTPQKAVDSSAITQQVKGHHHSTSPVSASAASPIHHSPLRPSSDSSGTPKQDEATTNNNSSSFRLDLIKASLMKKHLERQKSKD